MLQVVGFCSRIHTAQRRLTFFLGRLILCFHVLKASTNQYYVWAIISILVEIAEASHKAYVCCEKRASRYHMQLHKLFDFIMYLVSKKSEYMQVGGKSSAWLYQAVRQAVAKGAS